MSRQGTEYKTNVLIATHAGRLGAAVVTPSADAPGHKSVVLVGLHSDGPGGRAAGTAEWQSLLGQRLSHRRLLHPSHLTPRMAVDTVDLGAGREKSHG